MKSELIIEIRSDTFGLTHELDGQTWCHLLTLSHRWFGWKAPGAKLPEGMNAGDLLADVMAVKNSETPLSSITEHANPSGWATYFCLGALIRDDDARELSASLQRALEHIATPEPLKDEIPGVLAVLKELSVTVSRGGYSA